MKVQNKEHYAYFRHYVNYSDDYDRERLDYVPFDNVEAMKDHYQYKNPHHEGTYVKITPVKFETTIEVKE